MRSNTSAERWLYEISDADGEGVLLDLLAIVLRRLDPVDSSHRRWAVFDLDWYQREEGALQAMLVSDQSRVRPLGWQISDAEIRKFSEYSLQIIDGKFLAASDPVQWPVDAKEADVIAQTELYLQAFDSSFWRFSCRDETFAARVIENFKKIRRYSLAAS